MSRGSFSVKRVERFCRALKELGEAIALVVTPANIFYLTGMELTPFERFVGLAVATRGRLVAVLPALELQAAHQYFTAEEVAVWQDGQDPYVKLKEVLSELDLARGGILGVELGKFPLALADRLRSDFAGLKFVDVEPALQMARMQKDEEEIARIRHACDITVAAFAEIVRRIGPGARECEIAAQLDMLLKSGGAEGMAYETTVLSGPRSALPHGKTSEKTIERGELVLIDVGARWGGYCADFTRTMIVGSGAASRYRALYEVVREAQWKAIERVASGVLAHEVDMAARQVIESAGYGTSFVHRTGHGLGIEVHEAPSVGPASWQGLGEGMVVTIEPGVYIPGLGGIRLEDVVLVTAEGRQVLTDAGRELLEL